jgi:uncharacterized membrane protein
VSSGGLKRRLTYLDWLRGVSVLVMIEAHAFDAWTMPAEKAREAYGYLMVLGGMASPLFLFLAGTAAALAASSHIARGLDSIEAARRVERRGLQILLLAFLFRLQSFVLGGFLHLEGLLKVDVLNVMGPGVIAAGAFWRIPASRRVRGLVLAATVVGVVAATPALRQAGWVHALPAPLAAYLRPEPGSGAFTLLPWVAFVLAGAVLGIVLDAGRQLTQWRLHLALAAVGLGLGAGGYWAAWQPPLFEGARFWTTSPAFFCLRVGLLVLAVAAGWAWYARPGRRRPSPVEALGVGSLFVYWVHVELVYGWAGRPLRQQLTLEAAAVAWAGLTVLMYLLLLGWNRYRAGRHSRMPSVKLIKSTV